MFLHEWASPRCKSRDSGDAHRRGDHDVIDKTLASCSEAVAQVFDGATVMLGGFGDAGVPGQLIEALRQQGATNLVVVSNGAGGGDFALGGLIPGRARSQAGGFVSQRPGARPSATAISRARSNSNWCRREPWSSASARPAPAWAASIRRPASGTELAAGKETRVINGREYVFEAAPACRLRVHQGVTGATAWATSAYRARCATSIRSWRPPPKW